MDDAELFELALGLPSVEREAALRRACGGDEARTQQLLALVEFAGDAERLATDGDAQASRVVPARCEIGEHIGRYEVIRFLGQGSFGQVYEVSDLELRRTVALKLLREDRASDADLLRFRREAQSLAQIDHPGVVRVYDVGTHGDRRYLTMELIDGISLREWLDDPQGQRPWRAVLDTLLPAARGLQAAHAAGIVHRDFKPENVMIERGGRVVVTDFGIARASWHDPVGRGAADDTARAALTPGATASTASAIGTLRYMAPEQFHGRATPRSDEYAWCVVVAEALCPRAVPPSRDGLGVATDVPTSRHARLVDLRGPRWLRTILARGLAEDERDRYPDVATLVDAIERARRRRRRALAVVVGALVAVPAGYAVTRPASRGCAQWNATELARGLDDTWAALEAAASREPGSPGARAQVSAMRTQVEGGLAELATGRTTTCERFAGGIIDAATAHARDDCFARWHDDTRRRLRWFLEHPATLTGADLLDELPDGPARCGHVELPGVAQPVLDPAVEQRLEQLLAEATDRRIQGDYDASGRAAEEARALAERVDHAGYRAEVLLRLGVLAARERAWERAVEILREAAEASERSGMDALGAEVDTSLAETLALAPVPSLAEADAFLRLARAKLVRTGGGPAELEAKQAAIEGHIAHAGGRYAEAETAYRRAAEQYDALGHRSRHSAAATRANLARAIAMQGRYDEAIALAETALAERIAALGDRHPAIADDLYQLGLLEERVAASPGTHRQELLKAAHTTFVNARALAVKAGHRHEALAARILTRLTEVRLELGLTNEVVAREVAEIVVVLGDPQNHSVDPKTRLQALRAARNAYHIIGAWEEARRIASRVVATQSDSATPNDPLRRHDRLLLAAHDLHAGDNEAAAAQLRFLEATDPPASAGDSDYAATLRRLWAEIEKQRTPRDTPDATR